MKKPSGYDYDSQAFDFDEYNAYLNSKEWDAKRTERLKFDEFKCQICGDRRQVQVHHLVYPIHKNYGTEPLRDLITVCPACHKLIDDLRKGQKVKFNKVYKSKKLVCYIGLCNEEQARYVAADSKNENAKGNIPLYYYSKETKKAYPANQIDFSEIQYLGEVWGRDNITFLIKEEY